MRLMSREITRRLSLRGGSRLPEILVPPPKGNDHYVRRQSSFTMSATSSSESG